MRPGDDINVQRVVIPQPQANAARRQVIVSRCRADQDVLANQTWDAVLTLTVRGDVDCNGRLQVAVSGHLQGNTTERPESVGRGLDDRARYGRHSLRAICGG